MRQPTRLAAVALVLAIAAFALTFSVSAGASSNGQASIVDEPTASSAGPVVAGAVTRPTFPQIVWPTIPTPRPPRLPQLPSARPAPTATPSPIPTAVPTTAPAPSAPAPSTTSPQQYTLDLHNQARAAQGLPPLVLDDKISLAAQRNAQDMANRNYFAHVSPDGKQPWDWMREAGVTFSAAAQNIGLDPSGASTQTTSIKRLFDMMMAETPPNDGHRVNILNGTYKRLGVGVATYGSKLYWVCDFAN